MSHRLNQFFAAASAVAVTVGHNHCGTMLRPLVSLRPASSSGGVSVSIHRMATASAVPVPSPAA